MTSLEAPTAWDMQTRLEGRLWGISGFFSDLNISTRSIPFGGYFFQDTFMGGKILSGELVDPVGKSKITGGKIVPDIEFSFDKLYAGSDGRNLIKYSFKKQGDIWIGEYRGPNFNGAANCVINCLADN